MHRFLVAILAIGLSSTAAVGAERNFPDQARRGNVTAYAYPSMTIGERSYHLAAGSRIINQQNLIVLPVSLQIQTAPVMYLLDIGGDLSRVWLLTDEEAARIPLPK